MITTELLVPALSGLLAMLGAFVGAILARRTEYEKWFRQEKGKVFETFLRDFHDAFQSATDVMYDQSLEREARGVANARYLSHPG